MWIKVERRLSNSIERDKGAAEFVITNKANDLPNDWEVVLCTDVVGNVFLATYVPYKAEDKTYYKFIHIDNKEDMTWLVKAWQSLPEPYEEDLK